MLIVTAARRVSSVNTTAVLVPVLPAASVSWATMEWAPSPDSVTVVVHSPPEPTVAVPIGVVTPLTVSSNVTVAPTAASPAVTLPEIVWVATLEVSAARADRNRRRTRVEREHDRRAGAGVAGGIGVLGDDGVGAIARQRDGGGPQPARADGRGADRVVTPLTVSSNVTVAPTAASPAVTLPEIVWARDVGGLRGAC